MSRTVPGGPEQAEKDAATLFESRDLLRSWLPRTEDDVMPGANHLLRLRHPADAAARLADFLQRHPSRHSE